VSVELLPLHVHAGQTMKLIIRAPAGDPVTASVRYPSVRPSLYRGKVGGTERWVKTWKVPKSARPGPAGARISVTDDGRTSSTSIPFVVVR
jgi:hypothetical protein